MDRVWFLLKTMVSRDGNHELLGSPQLWKSLLKASVWWRTACSVPRKLASPPLNRAVLGFKARSLSWLLSSQTEVALMPADIDTSGEFIASGGVIQRQVHFCSTGSVKTIPFTTFPDALASQQSSSGPAGPRSVFVKSVRELISMSTCLHNRGPGCSLLWSVLE